jgi:hypothetical protein
MTKTWFKSAPPGAAAAPCSWEGWALSVLAMLLAAGVVLIGPGIRDNLLRPLFVVLGLAAVLVPYGLIARARTGG